MVENAVKTRNGGFRKRIRLDGLEYQVFEPDGRSNYTRYV